MLRNYLNIALRNLRRHAGYSIINITGLAVGLAACVLILRFVQDEFSYDRFHEKADQIYRIGLDAHVSGSDLHAAVTAPAMARTLKAEYPEVVETVRFFGSSETLVSYEEQRFYEKTWRWTDSTVFDVFTFPLVAGNPGTALDRPFTVVISETAARRYFGEADPVGKVLKLDGWADYEITGVMKNLPPNAHFPIDFMATMPSLPWVDDENIAGNNSFLTYLVLQQGADPAALEAKFPALVQKYVAPAMGDMLGSWEQAVASGFRWEYFLEPLTGIHLYSTTEHDIAAHGDARYVYVLLAVAVFILLIACINFMNLSTARSANRAKEVGIRKVAGSGRAQLVRQFLGESVLIALVAAVLAFGLILAAAPIFGSLSGKALPLDVSGGLAIFGAVLGVAVLSGLLAGLYPAFVLSAFQPVTVLKGSLSTGAKGVWLRRSLVVAQFGITLVLLVATAVVFEQLRYMQGQKLGFAGEQVVVLPIRSSQGREGFESFRQVLLQHPNVVEAGVGNGYPGRIFESLNAFRPDGAPEQDFFGIYQGRVSPEYFSALQVEFAAGRDFSREQDANLDRVAVINEEAARMLGWDAASAVGKRLVEIGDDEPLEERTRTIVGVTRDFHIESLQEAVKPIVVSGSMAGDNWGGTYAVLRVLPDGLPATLAFLEAQWKSYEPDFPYEYTFLDDSFGQLYENERRLGRIFGIFTSLAVFIACLGLFGLASFITQQRTKEIGVRKVLGASVPGIVLLLSREFTRMVLVAVLIAFPLAYFAMDRWLADFAYRTSIGADIFVLAGMLTLGIAWLTVSYQTLKAALADPVKSLRYE